MSTNHGYHVHIQSKKGITVTVGRASGDATEDSGDGMNTDVYKSRISRTYTIQKRPQDTQAGSVRIVFRNTVSLSSVIFKQGEGVVVVLVVGMCRYE